MTPKENLLRVIRHDGPGWVPDGMESVVWIEPPIIERPGCASRDPWGVAWNLEEGAEGGTFPAHDGHTIRELSAWPQQIRIPQVAGLDWSRPLAELAKVNRDEQLVMAFIHMGLFERSYLLLGMEEALVSYMTEPAQMYALVGAIADYKIELIRETYRQLRFDMVFWGDDWGNQLNLFMRPDVWRAILKPHTKRVFDAIHKLGAKVCLHSCGRVESVFEDIVEIGADIWNPCQPCNDLAALKRRFGGRITFFGGIDSQFVLDAPDVTVEKVRAEVRKRIDEMSAGGGYIAAPSHTVPYRQDLLEAMRDEIATYGRRVYSRA